VRVLDRAIDNSLTAVLSSINPSVRPSVCHTHEPRMNGLRYRNEFCITR